MIVFVFGRVSKKAREREREENEKKIANVSFFFSFEKKKKNSPLLFFSLFFSLSRFFFLSKKKKKKLTFILLFSLFLSLSFHTNLSLSLSIQTSLSLFQNRNIIYSKLQAIADSGATVVLSRLAIGDLATQFFADRDIFCAGRVPADDMARVVAATGAAVQSTVSDLEAGGRAACLGQCGLFEEKQVGAERFNVFTGCAAAKSATLVLRGGSEAFVDEAERSLHDAVMIVRRAIKNAAVVAGGGAIDMELSR